jgi:hypothetical protein
MSSRTRRRTGSFIWSKETVVCPTAVAPTTAEAWYACLHPDGATARPFYLRSAGMLQERSGFRLQHGEQRVCSHHQSEFLLLWQTQLPICVPLRQALVSGLDLVIGLHVCKSAASSAFSPRRRGRSSCSKLLLSVVSAMFDTLAEPSRGRQKEALRRLNVARTPVRLMGRRVRYAAACTRTRSRTLRFRWIAITENR